MTDPPYTVPLGNDELVIDHPDAEIAVPSGGESVDLAAAIDRAIEQPHGPPLCERVSPSANVAIVTTDQTRPVPTATLLDALISRLQECGISRSAITVVVGLGLHRQLDDTEIKRLCGQHADIATNHDPAKTVTVGEIDGVPVEVHRDVATADIVCTTGLVEPHQYAGFSGGAKTVAIGAGGESLIEYTHSPALIDADGVGLGKLDENPFRGTIDAAGQAIGIDFCLNIARGSTGFLAASAGDPDLVLAELAKTIRDAQSVSVDQDYELVVAGVGSPKDRTLYQASRGPTYIALGPTSPLMTDGTIAVPATLADEPDHGPGDRRFHRWLAEADDPTTLYQRMQNGYQPGAQRAFVLAKVLKDHDIIVTNSQNPELVESRLLRSAPDLSSVLHDAGDILIVPDAINTLLVTG